MPVHAEYPRVIPQNLVRAMLYAHGPILTVTGYDTIKQHEQQLPPSYTECFWEGCQCEQQMTGEVTLLVQAIQQGMAVAVSDGSLQEQYGAVAWTIEGRRSKHKLSGAGLTPGSPMDQRIYQSKLFGIWGILETLHQLVKAHQIKGQVVVACNGLSALKKASSTYPTNLNETNYDLISAIQNLCQMLPLTLVFTHVKGHQDSSQIMALPRLAWLNIQMDANAKAKLAMVSQSKHNDPIPNEGRMCSIEGQHIIRPDSSPQMTFKWEDYPKSLGDHSQILHKVPQNH